MRRESLGGAAMIAGAALGLVTMALHPTGHDVARDVAGQGLLAMTVHAIALASVPLSIYGAWVLTRWLSGGGTWSELAFVCYAVAGVGTILAATASGFLSTDLIARGLSQQNDVRPIVNELLHYTYTLSQAFARLYVAASSAAIILWSVDILRTRLAARGVGVYGWIIGALALALSVSGYLRLDIHGFGAVVLVQAVWLIVVGSALRNQGALPLTAA